MVNPLKTVAEQKYKIIIIFSTIAGGSIVGICLSQGWGNNQQLLSKSIDEKKTIVIPAITLEPEPEKFQMQASTPSNPASLSIPVPTAADPNERWTKFSGTETGYEEASFGALRNKDGKSIILSHASWGTWRDQEEGVINDLEKGEEEGGSIDDKIKFWFQSEEFRNAFKKLRERKYQDGTIWRELCVNNYSIPINDLYEKPGSDKWNKARDIFAWCTVLLPNK